MQSRNTRKVKSTCLKEQMCKGSSGVSSVGQCDVVTVSVVLGLEVGKLLLWRIVCQWQ